jgi:hypothetical protein
MHCTTHAFRSPGGMKEWVQSIALQGELLLLTLKDIKPGLLPGCSTNIQILNYPKSHRVMSKFNTLTL